MRIDELQLIAFGPFTDIVLDFSGGQEGFHLVYGPNEAGKSSALRALRNLLYGIPARSPDNFLHPYPKMRIGAILRSSKGDRLKFIRRKGRSNTLRESDDETVLEESVLQPFLSGIDSDLFATMFAIGYEDLVRGGQDIIQGGGDIGRLVFSAGSGISNLMEIQNELQAEADLLFRPSGQKQKINDALIQLNKNRMELKSVQLKPQDWYTHDKALRKALERKENVQTHLNIHLKNLNRFQRIQQALPLIAERKDLENDFKNYSDAIILPEEFPENRRDLISKLEAARIQKDQAMVNIDACKKSISQLSISHELLDNGDSVEELHLELGSQNKAVKDRVRLETLRNALLAETREILKNLDDTLTMEEAENRRIKKTEAVKIRKLGAEYERMVARIEDARKRIPEIDFEMDQIEAELGVLPSLRPVDAIRNALADAEDYSPQEKYNRSEQAQIESTLKAIEIEQNMLGLAAKSLREIESLSIPLPETIRIFEERFDAKDRLTNTIQADLKKSQRDLMEVESQMESIRLVQEVPTEEDLLKARQLRDMGWELISKILNNQSIPGAVIEDYLDKTPDSRILSEAYEKNLNHADLISDRLRREAGRVAEKAMLMTKQIRMVELIQQLERDLEIAEDERRQMTREWINLWEPLGIDPRTPREMRHWANDFRQLIQKVKDLGIRREKSDQTQRHIDMHRLKLSQHLHDFGVPSNPEKDPLTILIKKAQAVVAAEEELTRKREQLLRDQRKLKNEMKAARSHLESSEKNLIDWQVEWTKAVKPIGLNGDSQPEEANVVMDELKNLFEKIKEADILQKRIMGIDRDREEFNQKVTSLVEVVAQDLAGRSASEAALELHYRLKLSRDARTKKETLEKQKELEHRQLNQAIQNIMDVETQLKAMCQEAGCGTIDQLPEAERRSGMRREIQTRLEANSDQLRRLSGGSAVEEFIKEALEIDPDGISGKIQSLTETIEALNAEKSELDQTIGSERNELSRMDGSGRAADLAQQIQITLAGIESDAEHYSRLKIATKVLSMAIERYRDKSQGPVLKRASALFNQITDGAFESIRADYDDKGQPVIVGIRSRDREIVRVEGMSDGTADQLYLAMRLAGLERYLENNEPLPFIVDDILIKFDNARAAATLKVLAKISEKTQLIFFTHHNHLVELANGHISPSVLHYHSL